MTPAFRTVTCTSYTYLSSYVHSCSCAYVNYEATRNPHPKSEPSVAWLISLGRNNIGEGRLTIKKDWAVIFALDGPLLQPGSVPIRKT